MTSRGRAGGLLDVLSVRGLGTMDEVMSRLDRADRQALGLACKELNEEFISRWRCLRFEQGLPADVLRPGSMMLSRLTGLQEVFVGGQAGSCAGAGNHPEPIEALLELLARLPRQAQVMSVTAILGDGASGAQQGATPSTTSAAGDTQQQKDQQMHFPHLKRLFLSLRAPVGSAAAVQPLLRAPSLQRITILGLHHISPGGSLNFSGLEQLRELELTGSPISCCAGVRLVGLSRLVRLGTLRLACLDLSDAADALQGISSLPALEVVRLSSCRLPVVDERGRGAQLLAPHQQQVPPLAPTSLPFPCLRELHMFIAESPPPEQVQALQQLLLAMPAGLQALSVYFACCPVPAAVLTQLKGPGLPELRELHIAEDMGQSAAGRSWIDGAFLSQLATHQRRLQRLVLEAPSWSSTAGNHAVTTADVQAFLNAAPPELKQLQLFGFPLVHKAQLMLPANNSLQNFLCV